MKLCLNMIVRNEAARIERALASVIPYIDSWVIVDTGSTDDTRGRISAFFMAHGIQGKIYCEPFIDWSQARNAALQHAREQRSVLGWDYLMLMDADMELIVADRRRFFESLKGCNGYDMYQYAGAVQYTNRRLVSAKCQGKYVGVTHEYYDAGPSSVIKAEIGYFHDHADGANRPDKYKRDIALLTKGLENEPDNARYMFYLANTFADAGMPEMAIHWYKKRIEAGGWDQEVWNAEYKLAHCYKEMGQEDKFVTSMLIAYNRRPTRPETMYDLARHFREKKDHQATALAFAEAVEHLPKSNDSLFVNDFVSKVGIKEEIAICSFYVPGKRAKGLRICSELAQHPSEYWSSIVTARAAIYFYLSPLGDFCPSFKWKEINFEPPEHWAAMNPSVCVHHNVLYVNVRCVNYRIDENGCYFIRNTETGEINRHNPINTQNFILNLGVEPFQMHPLIYKCKYDMPMLYSLVRGFEDQRLFSSRGKLYSSSTVRQLSEDGLPEQVMCLLELENTGIYHKDIHQMHRSPRECEKNWAPILGTWSIDTKHFMWRPGTVLDQNGTLVTENKPKFRVDNLSGSSQIVPFGDGYLGMLHIAHPLPGMDYKRYYYHRFINYDQDMKVLRLSLPFYLNEKAIEFVNGMCMHPLRNDLVISYGFKDEEARIATVSRAEVEEFLCKSPAVT